MGVVDTEDIPHVDESDGPTAQHRRVLLVEDDRSTCKALCSILSKKGWDVILATTLSDGRLQLEMRPDCLVLDLMLPDGDGASLLREVRQLGLPIRVVVCSGTSDKARLEEVANLQPEALLFKPIRAARLLECLDGD